MAWLNGSLVEAYSVQPVRVADLFYLPPRTVRTQIDAECIIVEADYTYSYGDWLHCYLGTVLANSERALPVLIPDRLARKEYVQRDLQRANVPWIHCETWTLVKRPVVLRKPNPKFYWTVREVEAFRRTFAPTIVAPEPESLMYLGRFDLQGETISRVFPSERVARYVRSVGGVVVDQSRLNSETAASLAPHAETVIGDHGSGLLNIMYWQPKTVIELVVDDWWVNNTVFVASSIGVKNFAVLRVDGLSSSDIGRLIQRCLRYFQEASRGQSSG